jgi:hypothetical protein
MSNSKLMTNSHHLLKLQQANQQANLSGLLF